MTDTVKMPEPAVRQERWNYNHWGEIVNQAPDLTAFTEAQMKQYGDDREQALRRQLDKAHAKNELLLKANLEWVDHCIKIQEDLYGTYPLDVMKKVALGNTAMRFVDRAGDVHPGIDDAETICADFYKAMVATLDVYGRRK